MCSVENDQIRDVLGNRVTVYGNFVIVSVKFAIGYLTFDVLVC